MTTTMEEHFQATQTSIIRMAWMAIIWILVTITFINSETSSSSLTNNCRIHVMPGCTCANHTNNTLNIFCNKIGLHSLPNLDFGRVNIHTLSLQGNYLHTIDTGDFFGIKVERLLLGNNSVSDLDLLSFWGLEHLHVLDLSFNKLRRVPSDALRLLRNICSLSLSGNWIKTVENHAFMNLNHLEILSLDRNPIMVIQKDAFKGTNLFLLILNEVNLTQGLSGLPKQDLRQLKSLSMTGSNITDIPAGWFSELRSLRSLNLNDNNIRLIPDDMFKDSGKTLITLEMNRNKIKRLPRGMLRALTNLETLHVTGNRLRRIHGHSFNHSKSLLHLDLSHNDIKDLTPASFVGMENLETLDLRYNQLITFDERTLSWEGSRLRKLHLSHNPWLCNCILQWMKKDYRKRTERAGLIHDLTSLKCARPHFLAGKLIVRVPVQGFTCDHDYYYYYDDYDDYD